MTAAWDVNNISARRFNEYYYYLLSISDWTKQTIDTFALAETGRGLRPLREDPRKVCGGTLRNGVQTIPCRVSIRGGGDEGTRPR
jgi:hypothetical protein